MANTRSALAVRRPAIAKRTQAKRKPRRKASGAPIAIGRSLTNPSPRISKHGRITVASNSESLIRLVSSATAGTEVVGNIPLSARNLSSLPWLNQFGALYSKYRFRSLSCTYEPYCATTTNGEVCLAFVYDENDKDNPSSTTIVQTGGNVRQPVWKDGLQVTYDGSRAAVPWYVSHSGPPNNTLANLSVPAWLLYSAFSSVPSLGLGRVMVHYVAEFCDPVAPSTNS